MAAYGLHTLFKKHCFKVECTSYGANEMELFSKLNFTTTFTLISSHLVEATSSLVQVNGFKAIAFLTPPGLTFTQ